MAFGKRKRGETASNASSHRGNDVPFTSADFRERALALKDHVERIRAEAIALALNIKAGEIADASGFHAGFDPETHPIAIAGFSRHFNFRVQGKLKHAAYAFHEGGDKFDPRGQLTFFELATAVMRLNALCWSAHHEGGLTIALQSRAAGAEVDRIIVLAGYLGTMLGIMIDGMLVPGMLLDADIARRRVLAWGERALGDMIDRETFDQHYPDLGWPVWLVELEMEDHDGQLVVNNVYLPAEIARPVRAAMVREQTRTSAAA